MLIVIAMHVAVLRLGIANVQMQIFVLDIELFEMVLHGMIGAVGHAIEEMGLTLENGGAIIPQ